RLDPTYSSAFGSHTRVWLRSNPVMELTSRFDRYIGIATAPRLCRGATLAARLTAASRDVRAAGSGNRGGGGPAGSPALQPDARTAPRRPTAAVVRNMASVSLEVHRVCVPQSDWLSAVTLVMEGHAPITCAGRRFTCASMDTPP